MPPHHVTLSMWVDFRESRNFSSFPSPYLPSCLHSLLPFSFFVSSFHSLIASLKQGKKDWLFCPRLLFFLVVRYWIVEMGLPPELVACGASRGLGCLSGNCRKGFFSQNWAPVSPCPLAARPLRPIAPCCHERQPPYMAGKSLFGGFSIKCHMYFRAYVKNPQMNCVPFSVATVMDKTPTGKPQLVVSAAPQPKSSIFWLVGHCMSLPLHFSSPYSARSPLAWCYLC